jgi:hypothetical protein
MRRTALATTLSLAIATAAGFAQAQAELTEESVREAFEAQDFQQAFGQCFVGMDKPEEVTLVVIIDGQGKATLSKVEPMMLAQTKTCIQNAVGLLQFPATGGDYEITYPLAVPEVSGDAAHPVVTAQPATTTTQPVVVAQPAATAVQPQDQSWRALYSSGTRKMIIGGVLVGVAGAVFIIPGAVLVLYGSEWGQYSGLARDIFMGVGAVMVAVGLVPLIVGAVMLGRGRRYRSKAIRMRDGLASRIPLVGFGPTPDGKGGTLTLSWTF